MLYQRIDNESPVGFEFQRGVPDLVLVRAQLNLGKDGVQVVRLVQVQRKSPLEGPEVVGEGSVQESLGGPGVLVEVFGFTVQEPVCGLAPSERNEKKFPFQLNKNRELFFTCRGRAPGKWRWVFWGSAVLGARQR